jgi:uncharacterized protein (DUF2461 family)
MSGFDGFDRSAVALLAELPALDRAGYERHRTLLADGLSRPGLALVEEVAGRLDPQLTVAPRSSVSPLHRDLRFAAPGSPRYKDHLLLTTWQGPDKRHAPTLWIRLDAERVGFASGIGFSPEVRERWRSAVGGEHGAELVRLLEGLRSSRDAEVAGESLRRVPAPYEPSHPRADLLRRTGFQVRFAEALPAVIESPDFVDWCVARLDALMPVHRWLCEEVG